MSHFSISTAPVALITGSARRIGSVIVKTLHQAGYRVVIHYRNSQQSAQQLADSLNQQQPQTAAICSADLNQFSHLRKLIEQAQQIWQRLDVLINNASSFFPTPVGSTTEQQWDDLINTNLKGPYFLSQAAAPFLAAQQGCIINIADIHAKRPLKGYPVYSIAKAGLVMLTQSLAKELAPQIRVNAIAPGISLLPETITDEHWIAKLKEKTLLQRFATPEDIAQAVLFMIQQPAITGQILAVDCGRSIRQ